MSNETHKTNGARYYRVVRKTDAKPEERLIRATNPSAAIRFASRNVYEAEVASQDDVLRLASAGVKPEDATANAEQD